VPSRVPDHKLAALSEAYGVQRALIVQPNPAMTTATAALSTSRPAEKRAGCGAARSRETHDSQKPLLALALPAA